MQILNDMQIQLRAQLDFYENMMTFFGLKQRTAHKIEKVQFSSSILSVLELMEPPSEYLCVLRGTLTSFPGLLRIYSLMHRFWTGNSHSSAKFCSSKYQLYRI